MMRLFAWLATDATAAAQARRFVSLPCTQLPPSAVHEVLLMTTELVSNAVLHGAGRPRLDVRVEGERVTVGVTDRGEGEPVLANEFDWPNGRNGLQLVQVLADRWGAEPTSGTPGKRVWFELTCAWGAPPQELLRPPLEGASA